MTSAAEKAAATRRRAAPRKSVATTKKVTPPVTGTVDHRARRADIEAWLKDKCEYDFEIHPLTNFDVEKSLANQARLEPLVRSKVEEYRLSMERGELTDFPALVAYRSGKKLVVVDGNHRLNAAVEYGADSLPVYVVEAPEEVIRALTYTSNRRHGWPTSETERQVHAVHLVGMGLSVAGAARELGLSEGAVKSALNRTAADRRANELGIGRGWAKVPVSTKIRLAAVRTDEGFLEATKCVIAADLTASEAGDLVSRMNKSRSAKEQVEIAKATAIQYKGRIQRSKVGLTPSRGLTPFNRFLGTLTVLENYDPEKLSAASTLTSLSPGELRDRCYRAADHLMKIGEVIEANLPVADEVEAIA